MPTKRTRFARNIIPSISETALCVLSDGLLGSESNKLEKYTIKTSELWEANHGQILEAWIRARPGTRPSFWWLYDAPEPVRQRLGGIGEPKWEHLAYGESHNCGIPDLWITQDEVDMYNGRARDIHGKPITCDGKWFEGHFTGKAIDPNDPPRFESQATYLDFKPVWFYCESLQIVLECASLLVIIGYCK